MGRLRIHTIESAPEQSRPVLAAVEKSAGFRSNLLGLIAESPSATQAFAQMGPLHISGFAAWLLWSVAHIYFLVGFRNRFTVGLNWGWSYITFERGSRLITGLYARPPEGAKETQRMELQSKAS